MKLKQSITLVALLTPLVFSLCTKDPAGLPGVITPEYDDSPYELDYGRFAEPDMGDNPLTLEGVKLGRMLFYEKLLSKDNSISCGSCHIQQDGFSDPDQFSAGVDGSLGKRQAMPIFNMLWHTNEFFWDGRAHLLRDQSLMPIQDELEMKETLENVVTKLSETTTYPAQFIRAFGDAEITSVRNDLFFIVSQPELEVIASTASGTSVTCVGEHSNTKSMNFWIGFPSILNSVVTMLFKSRAS